MVDLIPKWNFTLCRCVSWILTCNCYLLPVTVSTGAHGVREEPQFVTARAGENVILGCDVSHPLNGQPYVVEWFKYGMPIPFFINFRFYPPHVDPEYAGKIVITVKLRHQSVDTKLNPGFH